VRCPEIAAASLAVVRRRPVEATTAMLVCGLLAGPRWPAMVPVLVALGLAVGGARRVLGVALAAALLGGVVVADARLDRLDRSALGPLLGHAVVGDATVLEPVRRQAFGRRAAVVSWRGEKVLLRAGSHVRVPPVRAGDVVTARGALEALGPHDAWLRPRNVHAVLAAESVRATGRRRGGLAGAVDAVRRRAEDALTVGVPGPEAALVRGMALGQDDALGERAREEFRAAGLAHLVAASGANVMLLAALALGLAAVAGVPWCVRLVAVLGLIALYVPLAGAGPSIQRAGVMGAAGVVALLAGRPAARCQAVLLAAAVTLAVNPRAAEEPGWQLSFAAVVSILVLARPLAERLSARGVPAGLAEATALTAAATIGTAPLVAVHFERTSLVALPANVLAVPAVAPAMWLGLLAAAAAQVSAAAASVPAALAAYPAGYLSWLAHVAAAAPHSEVRLAPAAVGVVCAAGAAVILALSSDRESRLSRRASPRRRRLAAAAVAAAASVIAATAIAASNARRLPPTPEGVRVSVLDVGQGDATLVQDGAHAVLVDAGPREAPLVGELRAAGVRRLDALLVTHAQADHAGGAAAVLRALPVALVLDGRDGVAEPTGAAMAAVARRRGVRLVPAVAGERLHAGAIDLRILSPSAREVVARPPAPSVAGAPPAEDPNQRAVVAEVHAGALSMLLTADAESDVLAGLDLRHVDVLKVAHHGSADDGLPSLLTRLRPRIATVSVGAGNRYGHPAPATIRALRAAGAAVLRTDRGGTIRLTLGGPHGRALLVSHAA
jgi:competence protein ComEC